MARDDETVVVGAAPRAAAAPATGLIGDHEVRSVIGGGGMASVVGAEDPALGRLVAIKLLQGGSAEESRRLRQEARITGQLEHPGIVPVHAAGTAADGSPWFSMKLIRGRTLAAILAEDRPAAGDRALLRCFVQVCQAVAFAHSRGVVHRDLKPANVMVGGFGETLVVDWGLALVHGDALAAASAGPAADEAVAGTPAYMAPEQAMGAAGADRPAVDVYALGAILYQMLTLEPPVAGSGSEELLAAAAAGRVVPARERAPQRGIPPGLAAVAARAMAWDPAERYPDAGAIAAEIERHLADLPVEAAAEGPAERLARTLRRHRSAAWTAAGAAAVLLAGSLAWAGLSTAIAHRALEAEAAAGRAEAASRALAGEAERARGAAERSTYGALVGLAAERLAHGQAGAAADLLERCPPGLRGWEWRHLRARTRQSVRVVAAGGPALAALAAVPGGFVGSVDGGPLCAWDRDGALRWTRDRPASAPLALAAAAGPGLVAAAADGAALAVMDARDGRTVAVLAGADAKPTAVDMHADGTVAWADGSGRLSGWRPRSGTFAIGAVAGRVSMLRFSPDGGRIAASSDGDRSVSVWAADAGGTALWRLGTGTAMHGVAWTPDRRVVAAWSRTRDADRVYRVRLCAAEDGTVTGELPHDTGVYALLAHPDGSLLTGAWDGTLARWSAAGTRIAVRRLGCGWITGMVRLADGRIAAAGNDGTIHLAAGADLEPAGVLASHLGAALAVAESDGRLASGGADGDLRLWEPDRAPGLVRFGTGIGPARVQWRGDRLEMAGDGGVAVWDGTPVPWVRPGPGGRPFRRGRGEPLLAVRPDGLLVAGCGAGGDGLHIPGAAMPAAWAVDARGTRIALAGSTGGIAVHDLRDGALLAAADTGPMGGLAWAGDDRLVAVPADGGTAARLLDAGLRPVARLPRAASSPFAPAAELRAIPSPDGRLIALIGPGGATFHRSADGAPAAGAPRVAGIAAGLWAGSPPRFAGFATREALLIDPESGIIRSAPGHRWAEGLALAAAPDGGSVASGGEDQGILVHRPADWAEPVMLAGHAGAVLDLAFLPDGSRLLSAGSDGRLMAWPPGGGPALLELATAGPALAVAVDPAGRVAVADHEGWVQVLLAPADQNPPAP